MKDQKEFKEELLRRAATQKAAKQRRSKILVSCTSLILCLTLLTTFLLRPVSTVKAVDLMEGLAPNAVKGTAADERFRTAQTDFALRLFKACAAQTGEKKTLVSPLSVMLALAMTANGADGQTKAEMEAVLGMPIDDLNRYLCSYVNQLPVSENSKVTIANSIWYRDHERLDVSKAFLQTNADYYQAAAYKAPFNSQTVQDINNWTKTNTDGMIDNIIDKISDSTVMYLINALAFDAKWEIPYKDTTQVFEGQSFTAHDGTKQKVTMMHQTEYLYIDDGLATGFMKPYAGGSYAFAAFLPNEGVSIEEYVSSLTAEGVQKTLSCAAGANVAAFLPLFRCDYLLEMEDVLKGLGMPTAFNAGLADFSPMATSGVGNIYISSVLHKTHITVDTQGTRASAVTRVEMSEGSNSPEHFVVLDRPFVYMIVDTATNIPLFIGTVMSIDNATAYP